MRLSSAPQRANNPQRGLSPADHAKATRLAREMALLSRLQGGVSTPPRGSTGTAAAAKQDYAELLALHGKAKLPTAFVVQQWSTLPAPVSAAFQAFKQRHLGRAEIAPCAIDRQLTWQAQVVQVGGAQVLLLDGKGHELARGVVRGAAVSWQPQSSRR